MTTQTKPTPLHRAKLRLKEMEEERDRFKRRAERLDVERIQSANAAAQAQAHLAQVRRVLGCVLLSHPSGSISYRTLDRLAETPRMRFKEIPDGQIGFVWIDTTHGKAVAHPDGNGI